MNAISLPFSGSGLERTLSFRVTAFVVAFAFLVACTDDKGGPTGKPGAKKSPKKTPVKKASRLKVDPSDPFQPDKAEVLFELYKAQSLSGQKQLEIYKHFGLVKDDGSPHKERQAALRQALKDFAIKDPEAWGDFVDGLGAPKDGG